MKIELTANEARVIGSLIEKQITTPDQYPLSLNALTSACNQKSNRDPVLALDEGEVQRTVDALVRKHLVIERSGFGSRVPKYRQCFCNAEFGSLKFSPIELAIVCELLLRGPQTPGELRTRAARMATIGDAREIEAALESLATRHEGAVVVRLPREPGRRDARYAQLYTEAPPAAARPTAAMASSVDSSAAPASAAIAAVTDDGAGPHADRIARLEDEVRALRLEVAELRRLVHAGQSGGQSDDHSGD